MSDDVQQARDVIFKTISEYQELRDDIENIIKSTSATYRIVYSDGESFDIPRKHADDKDIRTLRNILLKK